MPDHQAGHGPSRQLSERLRTVGPGWHPLLLRLHTQISALDADYKVEDLKEKLGTLRVRIVVPEPQRSGARDLVRSAEEQSENTCEFCGATGHRRHRGDAPYGWIKTVCDTCHAEWSRHDIMIVNGAVHRREQRRTP
ncbi:hypothetical protein ACGFNY_39550 [Streptomyces chartreusis]|uniref:hypothetical protein n=1 Tax=Streptomyces chartreusis TaxID=1969 RepID=UPI00371B2802